MDKYSPIKVVITEKQKEAFKEVMEAIENFIEAMADDSERVKVVENVSDTDDYGMLQFMLFDGTAKSMVKLSKCCEELLTFSREDMDKMCSEVHDKTVTETLTEMMLEAMVDLLF